MKSGNYLQILCSCDVTCRLFPSMRALPDITCLFLHLIHQHRGRFSAMLQLFDPEHADLEIDPRKADLRASGCRLNLFSGTEDPWSKTFPLNTKAQGPSQGISHQACSAPNHGRHGSPVGSPGPASASFHEGLRCHWRLASAHRAEPLWT